MGIAYALASWVLLQVVDLVLDNSEAPGWVMDVFMMVVVLGFIVSLIIAWTYEVTPEGIKRESEVNRDRLRRSLLHRISEPQNQRVTKPKNQDPLLSANQ